MRGDLWAYDGCGLLDKQRGWGGGSLVARVETEGEQVAVRKIALNGSCERRSLIEMNGDRVRNATGRLGGYGRRWAGGVVMVWALGK